MRKKKDMINYIQGQPLGRKFQALVCHDGIFSTLNSYSSEELYFPQHDVRPPTHTHPLPSFANTSSSREPSGPTAQATNAGTPPAT